jgi:hypothetical protein
MPFGGGQRAPLRVGKPYRVQRGGGNFSPPRHPFCQKRALRHRHLHGGPGLALQQAGAAYSPCVILSFRSPSCRSPSTDRMPTILRRCGSRCYLRTRRRPVLRSPIRCRNCWRRSVSTQAHPRSARHRIARRRRRAVPRRPRVPRRRNSARRRCKRCLICRPVVRRRNPLRRNQAATVRPMRIRRSKLSRVKASTLIVTIIMPAARKAHLTCLHRRKAPPAKPAPTQMARRRRPSPMPTARR